ncbi:efflux transporter outer membrane subunit [Pandoraea terrae]|uniref:efflux transporter outer membrane subunit n=1 Tax=Pandoraea terrae TaxID=1537710 RepID=UPI001CD2F12D|nr:efflux transporter outer membrane subunit [Pandoraea terrae]
MAVVAAGAALSACSAVGPDYVAPQGPAVHAAAFEAVRPDALSSDPLPPHWWRLYDNAQLDTLVAEALRVNSDLRVVLANLERARAEAEEARAAYGVQAAVDAGVSVGQASTQGIGPSTGTHGVVNAGLGIAYEVDVAGRIRRALEAVDASAQARQSAYELAQVTVAAGVVSAYTDACAAGARLKVARQSVALQRQSLALTARGASAGIYSTRDTLRSETLLAQLEAVVPPLEGARRTALYNLAVLTGHPPTEFPPALAQCETMPALSRPLPVGDAAGLIRRRPDIRRAERELAAATAVIGVKTAGLYPTVTLGANLGTIFRMGTEPFSGAALQYGLGPVISWSFPNHRVARARIDEASATARAALAQFDGTVLNALREAESALTLYVRHLEENERLRLARDASLAAALVEQRLAAGGTVSGLERLDTERTLAIAEGALAASDATLASDRVRIFLALGGGWEATARPLE